MGLLLRTHCTEPPGVTTEQGMSTLSPGLISLVIACWSPYEWANAANEKEEGSRIRPTFGRSEEERGAKFDKEIDRIEQPGPKVLANSTI